MAAFFSLDSVKIKYVFGSPKINFSGNNDVFIAKLNNSGGLIWNTFLGGSGNDLVKSELLSQIIILSVGGLLTGLLQLKIIKSLSKRSIRWIIISTLAWGISWAGFLLGGVILGLITGLAMLRLLEVSVQDEPGKVGKE